MAARPIWKGVIRMPGAGVPVKLFSAAVDRSVHFRLLHEKDGSPLQQRMVHPGTETPVDYKQALRGYPTETGYVLVDKKELDALVPAQARDIEVTAFVDPDRVGPEWYERPYYLGPDGPAQDYFALARALSEEHKQGIVRWTMRKREYLGALRAGDGHLMLISLHSKDEVVPLPGFRSKAKDLNPKELAMAEQLIEMYEAKFDPTAFRDEYRERLQRFLEAKGRGRKPSLPRKPRAKPEQPLAKALAESLRRARRAA